MKKNLRVLVLLVSALLFVSTNFVSAQVNLSNEKVTLVADGAQVYSNGKVLTKNEVMSILNDKPSQLQFYTKGKSLRGSGTGLLWGGIVASIGGIAMMVSNIETTEDAYGNPVVEYGSGYAGGVLLSLAGEAMIVGGSISLVMGKNKIARAVRDYNSSAYHPQPAKLNLTYGLTSRGLALALKF
jgi:hypothetical protein